MSQRTAKKLRQIYRRDIGQKAAEHARLVESKIQEQADKLGQLMKPAPKWIPEVIWVNLQKIFLNI
jgi:hypothetical protein